MKTSAIYVILLFCAASGGRVYFFCVKKRVFFVRLSVLLSNSTNWEQIFCATISLIFVYKKFSLCYTVHTNKYYVQRKELKQMLESLGGVLNTIMETLANLGVPMDEISAVIEPIVSQILGLIGM